MQYAELCKTLGDLEARKRKLEQAIFEVHLKINRLDALAAEVKQEEASK